MGECKSSQTPGNTKVQELSSSSLHPPSCMYNEAPPTNLRSLLYLSCLPVHYKHTESFDPVTGDVISIIPGHHRNGVFLHDVIKIENERLGLLVWRVKEEDVCHLEHLDPEIQPSRFLLAVASLETNNVTVDTSNIYTEYVHAVDDGEWEGDRDTLTQDMKLLCEGRDIRKV